MATTLNPPTLISPGVYRYTWTGTAPFRVFSYQTYEYLFTETEDTELYVTSSNGQPPQIEVFDSTESASVPQGITYPASAILQWRGYKYADYYRIDKYISAQWVEQGAIGETGNGYYQFKAPIPSTDVDTSQYRIVTVDKSGASTNADFSVTIIRNPDPPIFTASYNDVSGDLTLTVT